MSLDHEPVAAPTTAAPAAGRSRAEELLACMTLREKLAQITGLWVGSGDDGEVVAPLQDAMVGHDAGAFTEVAVDGLGHLTRVYGTRPVTPQAGLRSLLEAQRWLVTRTRLGIPALAHEECLTGLAAWQAATFPTPLAWGASFDPDLVAETGRAIGATMRALGVHQGLAPVLDVVRDARWGRVEECIGEDPYLVGELGTAYVRGLQSEGVVATLKHFVGYSASRAGRNLAPVHAGPREVADVLLVPFEMAVLDGGARSVMHSYSDVDGVPAAADADLLTGLLRERWGFDGTVVADYFGVAFLHTLHGVAADLGDAARQALEAGVDVELPTGDAYLDPLEAEVRAGRVPEALVDRAALRLLRQKEALGLLDADYLDRLQALADGPAPDLDPPAHRELAARLAEESVVLLHNDGTLPLRLDGLAGGGDGARVAVLGPNADRLQAMFGCYSFVNHVLERHPGTAVGLRVPTVLEALREEVHAHAPRAVVEHAPGCGVDDGDTSGIPAAAALAAAADVAVVVVGDQAGLFGRGTVGEGCDRDDLELPGVQRDLVEAVLATGTPVVLVLLTGRPYAVGWALGRCAAVVQAFFPGEAGGAAVAGVLSGRVAPSGRLPVSLPRSAGAQPYSYLHPRLGAGTSVTTLDSTPALPFGHGLSYTSFAHGPLLPHASEVPTDGRVEVSVDVTNTGPREGTEVVQLYGHDVVASVARPVAQLLGFARVRLAPGETARVHLAVPTTRLAFHDRGMRRVVEPGDVDLWVGRSCAEPTSSASVRLVGDAHPVSTADARRTVATVERLT